MAKSTEELQASKAGSTAESNGMNNPRPFRPSGVYQLKDDEGNIVDEQVLKTHPTFGDGQAAAFERIGYKYLRPAKASDIKEITLETKSDGSDDNLKGITARLNALEKENEELKSNNKKESK